MLERFDAVGYDSMEMWGGATFDVAVRFLKQDPWERVRLFKQHVKKTPLKMVLRAQNLVGYHAYPDDIVESFVYQAAEAGIDVFLTFDALQDLRNCETAFKAIKRAGKKIEGSVQYNISPFHTTEAFVKNALEQEQMGVSLMHVDGLDACVSALSMDPSVPAIETFLAALRGTSRDPKIDIGQFRSINDDMKAVRVKYAEFETKLVGVVEPDVRGTGDDERPSLERPDFKRPGDSIPAGIEPARQGCAGLARTWEDVLTYALFPNEATEFLKLKYGA